MSLTQEKKGQNLLTANHLVKSIYLANQEQVLDCAVAFASLSVLSKNSKQQPFHKNLWGKFILIFIQKHAVRCVGGDTCRLLSSHLVAGFSVLADH
jgi:hypothetical protein